ncbi:hypothetical protein [Methylocystis heyeri]|uniref:Uncharacterized protein n=1 Tax=Methylocystis heyeri TaxID=391905 RepID=A0A6B8KF31_9HYPH|nr:hypothetical protein [Methylocystis heyeri]QGM46222.1 hypothetical protein H2LOC_011245 [Methylocystis heyeri]
MGLFLAASAFRRADPQEIAQACRDYFLSHGVDIETVPPGAPIDYASDVVVYEPQGDWAVVLWPQYFGVNVGAAACAIAGEKDWLISTVKIYDGAYWEHLAHLHGAEIHSHCSRPGYWDEEGAVSDWDSDPEELAEASGVSADALRPYLVDAAKLESAEAKAFPEDRHELADVWVFSDFWRRLGVSFPEPDDKPAKVLRIMTADFLDKLPV